MPSNISYKLEFDPMFPTASRDFERQHVRPKKGRTLIVGSYVTEGKPDRRKRYADAIGIDMRPGDGVDIVHDLEERPPARLGYFDHIECMSVLEHSKRPWLLAENLEKMMFEGATIFVTAPFIWRLHNYPDDYWRFTLSGIKQLFRQIEWKQMDYAHLTLDHKGKIPSVYVEQRRYMVYTEACAFGVRK